MLQHQILSAQRRFDRILVFGRRMPMWLVQQRLELRVRQTRVSRMLTLWLMWM
jgi:hypothetical protein